MKTIRQLFRQSLKTLMGIALMTLAAAIVCLCAGQALAAYTTKQSLNQRFSTIGIPLVQESLDGEVDADSYILEQELLAWVDKMAAEHPDIVQRMAKHGILSAYIPEMRPYNPAVDRYKSTSSPIPSFAYADYEVSPFMPYTCAMLVFTLEQIVATSPLMEKFECEPYRFTMQDFSDPLLYWEYEQTLKEMSAQMGYKVYMEGTVTQVLGLEETYLNPVGRIARLVLHIPTLEALEAFDLVPGEQYIVYGMDYVDEHNELICQMEILGSYTGNFDRAQWDPFNPELLYVYTEDDIVESQGMYKAVYAGHKLDRQSYALLNRITMTLTEPASLIHYDEVRDASGYLQELVEKTQYTVTDENGKTLLLSKEEYAQRYRIPTIARLDGSVEDFLNTQDGEMWKSALEQIEFNNHAFAVIGVDELDYLAEFSLKRAQIVQGREFTAEELKNGSRVCLVQEALAVSNGLQIGDTITLNLYGSSNNFPYQNSSTDENGILNPTAFFSYDTTTFSEAVEYTIVGFYHCENWPNLSKDPYAFSANTIFVPKSSVPTPMEESNSIVFNTLLLQNGKIEAFHELAMHSGYAGRFKYNDQDYSIIAVNFHNYDALARQMLSMGVVLYVALLLLYLLLYPGSQKNNVRTMQSLGAGYFRRFGYILALSLGILIPASVLGGWFGKLQWDRLVLTLQTTAESTVALQIEPGTLTAVAAVQLLFALILTIFVALFVAAPKRISRRR